MYSNIETTDDDIFASAMEDTEIVDNPFVQGGTDGEPLHASDAASRLLDHNDNNATNSDQHPFTTTEAPAPAGDGNSMMGSSSLLERIQQQKKQQQTTVGSTQMTGAPTATTNDDQFGYPMVQEGSYSTSRSVQAAAATGGGVHIPQYSQAPAPNPYNTDSPYTTSGMTSDSSDIDYKEKFMTVLSVMGSAAGTVAKGAYQGGKIVYEKMTSKNNLQGGGAVSGGMSNVGGGAGMTELDYQRESLLMDPHDLEDRAAASTMGSIPTAMNAGGGGMTSGMRAGIISANNNAGNENSIVTCMKQFAVDMKDLFLGASRGVQIGVIALIVFIIWLLFFE